MALISSIEGGFWEFFDGCWYMFVPDFSNTILGQSLYTGIFCVLLNQYPVVIRQPC